MTETTKTAADTMSDTYASIAKAFGNLQDKFEIPEQAREFVKRSTATAKERTAEMHEGANKVAGSIERAVINAVTGVADFNRKLFEAAREDAEAALGTIEKLAGAKSVSEAYQLQVDYLRERGEVGLARAKSVAEFVTAKVNDGVQTMQDGIAKVVPGARKAA